MTLASALTRPVRSLFEIEPGEAGLVGLMVMYSAAAAGGVWTIGFNGVGQALFLSRLPASDVPFTFILPAAAIVLTLVGYSRLAARVPLPPLAAGSSALLLLLAVTFRVLLALGLGSSFGLLAGIYLYCEAAGSLVLVQFWTFAGQIFNPRQARRLFGLIAAGGTLASAAAGVVLALLTRAIGVDNLILVVGGSCGVCGACALLLRRHVPSSAPSRDRTTDRKTRTRQPAFLGELRDVWRTPLLRSIGLITVLVSLLVNIGAYQFFLVLHAHYAGQSAALAGFLGTFAIWTGLAALVMQLFGTRPVMVRFGALATQAIFPLAMAAASGTILLAWGALWAVTVTRGLDPALRRTVHDASINALYLPLPAEQRQRAKPVLEGVYALAFGLAGAIFLLIEHTLPSWTYQYWSVPVLLLSACWLVVLIAARTQYVATLARSIDTRRLSFDDFTPDLADEATTQVLARTLRDRDDRVVIHVLALIAAAPGRSWLPHVIPLLLHPSPQVRVTVLRCLDRDGSSEHAPAVAKLLAAPEDEVSAAAAATLAALLSSQAIDLLVPLLSDPRPRTAGTAAALLLWYGDDGRRLAAAALLRSMLGGDTPAARRAAARALGDLAGAEIDPEMLSVLLPSEGSESRPSPPPTDVRIACLVGLLRDSVTRSEAATALTRYGETAVSALAQVLAEPGETPATRKQAATLLQRIGGSASARALLDSCGVPDPAVRDSAARALADLRVGERASTIDESLLETRIRAEITECYRLRVWAEDLRTDSAEDPLNEALAERGRRALDRVFSLLQARYPDHDLARAHVATACTGETAMAAELLDSVVDRRLAEVLLPLVEGSVDQVAGIAAVRLGITRRSAAERLIELAGGSDPWLRACAISTIGRSPAPVLPPVVLDSLSAGEDLVRETALSVCRQCLDPERFAAIVGGLAQAESFPLTSRYARALLQEVETT